MQTHFSIDARTIPVEEEILDILDSITEEYLQEAVKTIAIPRNYFAEPENNKAVSDWIFNQLESYGFNPFYQGEYGNIISLSSEKTNRLFILIGAHFDSVPGSPGADDNASAVAAMLACAKAIHEHNLPAQVCFAAFNAEENDLAGSKDFVENYLPESGLKISRAHILEMVGYCRHEAGSQCVPPDLPIKITTTGNFLGLVSNKDSNNLIRPIMMQTKSYLPEFHVIGLKVFLGMERFFPNLSRSDHVPFWKTGLPALMWTDTSEFRNPNYHRPTDTPDTLDYGFLADVARLLLLQAITFGK